MMVGFSDGFVRGYSKGGTPVFSQLFHLESVKKLTCMASVTGSQRRAVSNVLVCVCGCAGFINKQYVFFPPQNNNLVVLYQSLVCVIEGSGLVELIKRNVANISAGMDLSHA